MPVKKLEALADAISALNDYGNPESPSYQLRNPGLVRAHSFKQLNAVDDQGRRIFTSLIGGYRFLIQDLQWKCEGTTRAKGEHGKLKPESTLVDLLKAFRLNGLSEQIQAVTFLNAALQTLGTLDEVKPTTELKFFLEGDTDGN
jgi:hypothetical protein